MVEPMAVLCATCSDVSTLYPAGGGRGEDRLGLFSFLHVAIEICFGSRLQVRLYSVYENQLTLTILYNVHIQSLTKQ